MALAGSNRKPALIAAARKISYSRADTSKLKEESWQERAWQVYDRLPAVFYMTRYRSDIASKVDYFAAAIDSSGNDPAVDATFTEGGELQTLGEAAKILEVEGGPDLLRRLVSEMVVHWDVPGEGYLCRFDEAPFWRVLSTQELKKTGNDFTWGDATNSMGPIDADNVYRVWDPHPRFHWQADSPTRHIVEDAEELILLGREAKARSMSRLSAGILWISDNTDLSPFAADEEGDEDAFARQLSVRLGAPIRDPGSAASIEPWVISAHPEDIAAARHMTFERDWDINLDLRRELLRSVATGLDLPPEILTGVADLNHWSAWLVSEMAVSQHVLPTVDAILDSLTTNWFKPLLEAGGVDPDGFVLWRDPSPATVPPDQSDVAVRLFELGGISGEAVRRVTNFDEDDAPTPEEIEQRIAKAPNENPREPDGPPPRDGLEASISPDLISLVADEVTRRFKEGGSPLAEAAVVAAVRRRVDAKALADIDRELLEWLVSQSQIEMDRLMVFASEAVTAATDPLDESLLARFRRQVEKKISEAQAAARGWVENLTGRRTSFVDEVETRQRGVDRIITGLLDHVRSRLFTPSAKPDPIDVGRFPDRMPPVKVLREGMSIAGGGQSVFEGSEVVDGIGNGQRIHDELEDNGFRPELMVWRTGTPSHPFDPHQRLEGVEFDTWDSPKLAITLDGQWVSGSYYRPGDHRGCQCSVEQLLTSPAVPGDHEIQPTVGGEGNIRTDGMTPEEAADYISTKKELEARYPEVAAGIKHWGTGEDPISLERFRGTINAERFPEIHSLLDAGDFDGAFRARYGMKIDGLYIGSPGNETIIVRPGSRTSHSHALGEKPWNVDSGQGWSPTRQAAIHEFGHATENHLMWQRKLFDRTPLSEQTLDRGAAMFEQNGSSTLQDAIVRFGNGGSDMSQIGAANSSEGFAERFLSAHAEGEGAEAFEKLMALAKESESWPTFWDARPTNLMDPTEWRETLEAIGSGKRGMSDSFRP